MCKLSRHLLDINSLNTNAIAEIIDTAKMIKTEAFAPLMSGRTVVLMFAENSTRTKLSFEKAALNLGMKVLHFDCETSSFSKGESLKATVDNLFQMGVDALVLRSSMSGILHNLAGKINYPLSLINAGDGNHAHPTQALLDFYTMTEKLGTVEGKKVTIVGDIAHSRVARSNVELLKKFGANVNVCAPSYFMPTNIDSWGIRAHQNLENAIDGADVVMALRVQNERLEKNIYPPQSDYVKRFQLTSEKLEKHCNQNVLLMHPGPVNPDVEISSELMESEKFGKTILEQVENGVYVRMSVFYNFVEKIIEVKE